MKTSRPVLAILETRGMRKQVPLAFALELFNQGKASELVGAYASGNPRVFARH